MSAALTAAPLIAALAALVAWVLVQLDEHHGTHQARPVNGRNLGTLPRIATPDHPPWRTAGQPVLTLTDAEIAALTPHRAAETSADLVPLARPYAPPAVYGEVPVQRMLAQQAAQAERLAGAYLP